MNRELFNQLVALEKENKLNKEQLEALEPYRVKRAIIMAAGFGSRMMPITLFTPKPLVTVNGVRIIETLIEKIVKVGIKEIYLVRGYLKQQFDVLLEKYPFIKFIDNDDFDKENNISSAIRFAHLLDNTYVCEADFVVRGDDVITKYQYESNYLGTPVKETDDWCYDVDSNDVIHNYRKGGKDCYQAFGISYWNEKDGAFLAKKLLEMHEDKKNRQEFWEMCFFSIYQNEFNVHARACAKESIFEIDSFDELCAVDPSHRLGERKRIGVVGAGNMGTILATKFSLSHDVALYDNVGSMKNCVDNIMNVRDEDNKITYSAKIKTITSDLKEFVSLSDYIFITFPSFLFKGLAKDLIPLLHEGQHLIFIPGSGGAEFYFHEALKKGVTISGLQRVHCVARILEPGKLVRESGKKSLLKVASIPSSYNHTASMLINELFGIKVHELDNYLNITLINSNAVLHTSRLYNLFHDYHEGVYYSKNPLFYESWNDETSILLEKMDNELASLFPMFETYGLPVKDIPGILPYYDSETPEQMTRKIISIAGFKGLYSPMKEVEPGKFIPDFSSRYFTADFPFGLDIILEFLRLFEMKKDNCEMVSSWYKEMIKPESVFSFKDFNINTKEELINLYK
ncbi:MAG: NAD/NADP octopine/nopaline dehydrogenase family protein [Bacilli bacterium]|nr:NAD/NADP octopine/nopaline dehydrogenase family protein [Bacilli bacterium]